MTVVFDQGDGGSLVVDSSGTTATRFATISGVAGTGDVYLYNALQDVELPNYGTLHPSIPGLYLLNINITPMDCGKARAVLTYRTPDQTSAPVDNTGQGIIEVGASAVEVDTEKDVSNNQITVAHDFTSVHPERGLETQGGTVRAFVPQMVLRQTRKESSNPGSKASTNVGKINSSSIWGFNSETLLCTQIGGISDDNGDTYNVTYEFQYNPDGWDSTVVFIDPETGRPPPGLATSGVDAGVKTVQVLEAVSFSGLNLNF